MFKSKFHRATILAAVVGSLAIAQAGLAATTTPGIGFQGAVNLPAGQNTANLLIVVKFTDSAGVASQTPIKITVNNGDSDQTIATALANFINTNPNNDAGIAALAAEWKFAAQKNAKNVWICQGTLNNGKTATASSILTPVNGKGVKVTDAIDPQSGYADFGLTGTATGDGSISIGIDAQTITSLTDNPSTDAPLTDAQIENNLLAGLDSDGFTQSFIDPSTQNIVVPNVDTGDPFDVDGGDPDDSDLGATFESTDSSLLGFAEISVPEPGAASLVLLAGGFALFGRRVRSNIACP
jgi:hypothetical protein